MVQNLVMALLHWSVVDDIIVTNNITEPNMLPDDGRVIGVKNLHPSGFGTNHNAAFRLCGSPFFCVANPDISLLSDPFAKLIACMEDKRVGLVAPRVVDLSGNFEDNARYFPSPLSLGAKMFGLTEGRYPVTGESPVVVDWVAGMFMFFRAEAFRDIGGFDEDFFLYYEDVDICARLWMAGWKVMLHPGVTVNHAAQRMSRRNPRYTVWHLSSMARYFAKHLGRLPRARVG